MFRTRIVGATAALALLGFSGTASADHEPFSFGIASKGDLRVVSGALVGPRSVDLRGVWLNETVACDQWRRLRVSVTLDYRRGATTRRISRTKQGLVRNCAEGGPNFGFTLRARPHGLACANGRWKPGIYTFVVRTLHRATGIEAAVSLDWNNRQRC